MIALPCPGVRACAAPQKSATASATRTKLRLRSSSDTSDSNRFELCSALAAAPILGGSPASDPGLKATLALLTVSGSESLSSGYASSASLRLSAGALERSISAPRSARTTTSCQPLREA